MPENTNSNTAPGSVPKSAAEATATLPALMIPPCGVEVYTDLARQKSFTVLHFKHSGGSQTDVLVWIGDVLDQLAAAGFPATGPCDIALTPDVARSSQAKPKRRCYLKVPVGLP